MADSTYQGGVIRWEDPPPATVGRQKARPARPWAIVAADLRSRPGKWGLIEEHTLNPGMAARINSGVSWFAPAGSFEAVARGMKDGSGIGLWACYVGDQEKK